ncbi:unnamed protein product [Lactuca saligna]|uniref:Uncharacterized protein n=1 Tax=Lactuca saligna TaxID=75948 RepID=A0AA35VH13_LACSI|nr:unnamed protein product [Lactuca saligna]
MCQAIDDLEAINDQVMDTVNVHNVGIDTSKVKVTNRFNWDSHTFKMFLEECMNELKNRNKPDTIPIGDKAKVPCKFGDSSTPDDIQFVDITDGKEATYEVLLFDDVDPFLKYDSSASDFNMCFTFMWDVWERSAHDTKIFNEARRRREFKFPLPADDTRYPNTKGYIAPYKGSNIHYHIPDFQRGQTNVAREP